jgi:hypothetical protein
MFTDGGGWEGSFGVDFGRDFGALYARSACGAGLVGGIERVANIFGG